MKKLSSLLLVLSLLLGLLSGCGGQNASTGTKSIAASEVPEAVSEAPAPASVPAVPEEDSSEPSASTPETTVSAYAPVDYSLPLFDETAEISLFYVLRGAMGGGYTPSKDSEESIFWARLQENLNVDLIFTEPSEAAASEQYNLMIAGGDMTDLICENNLAEMGAVSAYNGGYDKAIDDDVYRYRVVPLASAPVWSASFVTSIVCDMICFFVCLMLIHDPANAHIAEDQLRRFVSGIGTGQAVIGFIFHGRFAPFACGSSPPATA